MGVRTWTKRISWLLLAGLLLVFVTLVFGRVSGREISPWTFQRRTFRYYRLPIVHWQVTPVSWSAPFGSLSLMLQKRGWVQPPSIATPAGARWHLAASGPREGDAAILEKYLYGHPMTESFWEQWTTDHGQLAAQMWPEVHTLALQGEYLAIGDLFERALRVSSKKGSGLF